MAKKKIKKLETHQLRLSMCLKYMLKLLVLTKLEMSEIQVNYLNLEFILMGSTMGNLFLPTLAENKYGLCMEKVNL